jgi:ankyrin repeat protein
MLGNLAVAEELASRMVALYSASETISGPSTLQPLDRVGEMLLTESGRTIRGSIKDMDFGNNPVQYLERLISYGDDALLEEVVSALPPELLVHSEGSSPLHLIAECGFTSMMKRILPLFKDLNSFQPPLLHSALRRPTWNMDMISVLIQHGVDVNAKYSDPISDREKEQRRTGFSVHSKNSFQYAAVHVLASGKYWWYPQALREVLKAGVDAEALNDKGETALQLALAAGNPEALSQGFRSGQTLGVLLDHGVNVNLIASGTNLTPLNTALKYHRGSEIVQRLLDRGADGSLGPISAIASAIESYDYTSLGLLLEAGANPNQVYRSSEVKVYENDFETPLQSAACNFPQHFHLLVVYNDSKRDKRAVIISLLLEHGANPDQQLKDSTSTVLHEIAAKNGFIKAMLVSGVNLDERDANGRTPLIRAWTSHHTTIVLSEQSMPELS